MFLYFCVCNSKPPLCILSFFLFLYLYLLYWPDFYWYLPIVPIITHNSLICNNIWQYLSLLYQIITIPKKRGGLNECGGTWCQLQLPFKCTPRRCNIDIWILWPWESNPVFTDILQKRTLEIFFEVLCCKIQSCRTESCLTPPCWKSLLKNKPRVMKCWEMIVTCSSPGFTTPAKSFLNPFEPLWSFL